MFQIVPYEINITVRIAKERSVLRAKNNYNSLKTLPKECEKAEEGLEMIMNEFMGVTVPKVIASDTLYGFTNIYVFDNKRI